MAANLATLVLGAQFGAGSGLWRLVELSLFSEPDTPVESANTSAAGCGGGALAALRQAADTMTSPRSILLVCPSAPSTAPGCSTTSSSSSSSSSGDGSSGSSCSGALGFRDTFYTAVYAMWTRTPQGPAADGDAAHAAWVRAAAAGLSPHVSGLYVNEVMHDQPGNSQVRSSYEAAAYVRLQALKARLDPGGLLRAL